MGTFPGQGVKLTRRFTSASDSGKTSLGNKPSSRHGICLRFHFAQAAGLVANGDCRAEPGALKFRFFPIKNPLGFHGY